jgi:hypothetical protein
LSWGHQKNPKDRRQQENGPKT